MENHMGPTVLKRRKKNEVKQMRKPHDIVPFFKVFLTQILILQIL